MLFSDSLENSTTMCYYSKVNPDGVIQVDISKFIENNVTKGRYHFTTEEAARNVCVSHNAACAALRRLRSKGIIATPYQGFNLFVPPEYRRLGCLPPEQFVPQLMAHLGLDYYVGLLSAAEIKGAAHQRPQKFQVIVAVNRPQIRCGDVRIQFVARRNVSAMPTFNKNTPRGYMTVANVETTVFDLIGYRHHSGGFDNVATVLSELREAIEADELVRIAPLSPVPWRQRLGYILDIIGATSIADPLARHVAKAAREYVLLNTKRKQKQGERSRRWKLIINDDVESDL